MPPAFALFTELLRATAKFSATTVPPTLPVITVASASVSYGFASVPASTEIFAAFTVPPVTSISAMFSLFICATATEAPTATEPATTEVMYTVVFPFMAASTVRSPVAVTFALFTAA